MQYIIIYSLKYYSKKFRYVAPLILFVIFLRINYSQNRISIWNNYDFTILITFIFSVWISYGFFEFEDKTQEHLSVLHSKSILKFHMSKILANIIILIPLDLVVTIVPVIGNLFNREIAAKELILALLLHILASIIALAVTSFFMSGFIRDKSYSILIFFSIIILTAAKPGIISSMPYLGFLKWILPPINILTVELSNLNTSSIYEISVSFCINFCYEIVYPIIFIIFYFKILKKNLYFK